MPKAEASLLCALCMPTTVPKERAWVFDGRCTLYPYLGTVVGGRRGVENRPAGGGIRILAPGGEELCAPGGGKGGQSLKSR